MPVRRLVPLWITIALLLAGCAGPTPTAVSLPTATNVPTSAATVGPAIADTLPYPHTACAPGVDLTGQTINFYHLMDLGSSVNTFIQPLQAAYADATAYLNAHGGLCGATIKQVYPDPNQQYDPQQAYAAVAKLSPRPPLVILYSTSDGEDLRAQLMQDQMAAVGFRVGSDLALYGADGQTPGWIFSTNPRYGDQIGTVCDYLAAHPERFPKPVIGFINNSDLPSGQTVFDPGHQYCRRLGIGDAGGALVSGNDFYTVQPAVQKLVKSGATVIFTLAYDEAPASIAHNLVQMGVQNTVTLAAYNWAFDPASALVGETDLGADGLPMLNHMIGSMPARSLAEADNPGIQLISRQAQTNQRGPELLTNAYVKAWSTADLLREVYVQTGNRVGYDHITSAEIKATLETIVYTTLGGVERIDFQGGARRTLATDRVGQLGFLGQDGKTLAGPGNPPKNVSLNPALKLFAPMLIPLTDYQPAPDLRPGGPNAQATAAPTVAATNGLTATGRIVYFAGADHSPDNDLEIFLIHPDGSGKIQLTKNLFSDDLPALSPDGKQLAFVSNRSGSDDIYVMPTPASQAQADANANAATRLTTTGTSNLSPQWSPDGQKIVFQSDRDGNPEIYVMNADGSGQTRLTNNASYDGNPNWSPDGKLIAFDSNRSGNAEVYVMPAPGSQAQVTTDGSGVKDLTNNPANDYGPDWSPDGQHIAFISERDGQGGQVYVMSADGSHPINLSKSQTNDFTVSWSTDGNYLVFSRDQQGIDIMRADGTGLTVLTHNPIEWAITPNWGN